MIAEMDSAKKRKEKDLFLTPPRKILGLLQTCADKGILVQEKTEAKR
jgi:hypothetical protein